MTTAEQDIHYDPSRKIQKRDVFGYTDPATGERHKGMLVAFGKPDKSVVCPIFGDVVPFKSVTVACKPEELSDVLHWLAYVHGGEHSADIELEDGRIAIRSDYQAW